MSIDMRKYAAAQFRAVLTQRSKEIAEPLIDALDEALLLERAELAAVARRSPTLPAKRYDAIDRAQIGKLARSFGHFVASSTTAAEISADAVRQGYERWIRTRGFRTIAPRYHMRGQSAAKKDLSFKGA